MVLASLAGGSVGAFVALVKLMPERSKMILEYQDEAMESLRKENKRQAEIIARLEVRVEGLEARS